MRKKHYGSRLYRSWIKKHRKLPTPALTDPFLGVPVRINRNGRTISIRGWQMADIQIEKAQNIWLKKMICRERKKR